MTKKNIKKLAREIVLFFSILFLGLLFFLGCIFFNLYQSIKASNIEKERNVILESVDSLQKAKATLLDNNSIYKFLKENKLTDKDEIAFLTVYQKPDSAKVIYNFMIQNKLTDLNESSFYEKYLSQKDIDKYFKIIEQTKIRQSQVEFFAIKKTVAQDKILNKNDIKRNLLWFFAFGFAIVYVLRPIITLLKWSLQTLRK